jgi:5-methyltetrahydrofolate--homocysteine methyltransferase
LESARDHAVDVIGLSGLITPSLDEMVHVAKEMQRQNFKVPLLIGGATTSRIHTAVKIDPNYEGTVVHVLDASRSVPVVGQVVTKKLREDSHKKFKSEYQKLRENHKSRKSAKNYVSIEEARKNAFRTDWENYDPPVPGKLGITEFRDVSFETLRKYIDWTPFFQTWMLSGKFPAILEDKVVGKEAGKLFDDANAMIDSIIQNHELFANGVVGLFPAVATGDDVVIFDPEDQSAQTTIHFLRQQNQKAKNLPNFCLADFVAPKEQGKTDYIGGFAVTAGIGMEEIVKKFEKENDDYKAILIKAIADRFAEAFAEYLHEQVRKEYWGYASGEKLDNNELISEKYQGIRPAPGYPACPDHTEKQILFDLLNATRLTGISLTESFAMYPAASVSGWYFSHPGSKYFGLGKIGRDQVEDYAKRKNMELSVMEKWLSPNLNYDID